MKKVQLITDGSCIGNPGPGGWACILRDGSDERELSGSEAQTTNNRMELTAAITGLRALRETCEVELVTDSQYLKQGITEFLARWKTNGWRTANRKPVQNQDLWRELDQLVSQQIVHWTWVAGHGDHEIQNRCDALAAAAARRQAGESGSSVSYPSTSFDRTRS
jgi:ribonuclease HI